MYQYNYMFFLYFKQMYTFILCYIYLHQFMTTHHSNQTFIHHVCFPLSHLLSKQLNHHCHLSFNQLQSIRHLLTNHYHQCQPQSNHFNHWHHHHHLQFSHYLQSKQHLNSILCANHLRIQHLHLHDPLN